MSLEAVTNETGMTSDDALLILAAEGTVRALVVDELRNFGVISEKKARKRLMKIADMLPEVKTVGEPQ